MKHSVPFIFLILLFWQNGFAQESKVVQEDRQEAAKAVSSELKKSDDIIPYKKLDKSPEFPGGPNEYAKLLTKKIKLPSNNIPLGNHRLMVSFCIETDGTLTDIKIIKDPGYGIGDEVKRILPLMPKWKPGEQNGKPVRSTMHLPFYYIIRN